MKQICLVIFLTANIFNGQKIVKKSIVKTEIASIAIDLTNIFELSIDTAQGNEMVLEASIDGEYSKDLMVNVRELRNTLFVSTGFQPNFRNPNDKLSAHKVISIALKLLVPPEKKVTISGTGCNVSAKGRYATLKVTLSDGSCHLESISGTAEVATQSGTITVSAASAKISATSKYGTVDRNRIPSGDTFYAVRSVTGDILFDKIE